MDLLRAYAVLGLERDASFRDVRAAYKAELRRVHPDAGGVADPLRLDAVRVAYRTIVAAGADRIVAEREPPRRLLIDVYA